MGCALPLASRMSVPRISLTSPHHTGNAGSGQPNLHTGMRRLEHGKRDDFIKPGTAAREKETYGPGADAQLDSEETHTPGLEGHSKRPTVQPFHGCFLAHSDRDDAQMTSFPGQIKLPVDPAGQAGAATLEQEVIHVPSAHRMVRAGQGKTGARGVSDATHRSSTWSNAGVLFEHRLASARKCVRNAAAEAAQAAMLV